MFGGKAVGDLVKYANRVDGRNDRCRNGSSGGNDGAHSKGNRDGHRNSERGTARADYHRATGAERDIVDHYRNNNGNDNEADSNAENARRNVQRE